MAGDHGCHQRNIHGSGMPRTLGQALCLLASYTPSYIALALILGIMGPYYHFFVFDFAHVALGAAGHTVLFWYSLVVGTAAFAALLTSYFRCMFTSPGFVNPDVWCDPPRVLHHDGVVRESRAGSRNPHVVLATHHGHQPRYCDACRVYKPDRSHHCSECGKCVLRMDHHCPWVSTCVGFRTSKYFVLFLAYIGVSGLHIAGTIAAASFFHPDVAPSSGQSIGLFLLALCGGVFAGVLGLFALFHVFLVISEETTVGRRIAVLTGRAPREQPSAWWLVRCCRLGCCSAKSVASSFEWVMGDAAPWWHWLVPVAPTYGPRGESRFSESVDVAGESAGLVAQSNDLMEVVVGDGARSGVGSGGGAAPVVAGQEVSDARLRSV